MKCSSYFPNFPTCAWLSAPYLVPTLILSGYTYIRQLISWSGYEFKPCPMYNLTAKTFWSWCGPLLFQSMPRHAFGHHVGQGLLPVSSMDKTALLQGRRSLAGLKKRGMDHLVTHPKDTRVCLGIEAKHYQFQYLTTPKHSLLFHVAQLLHTTPRHLAPSLASLRSFFLSLSSQACIQCDLALALRRLTAFSSQCEAEVGRWYRNSFRKLCVCVCSF